MSVQQGTTFGPYSILGKLGSGGMGEVYRAHDPRIGREVAIKLLPASLSAQEDFLIRFEQEAKAAGMLNHPNLLTIFDVGRTKKGSPFIVSELLHGETLRDRLNESPIPPRKVIDYALQVAQGLAAAHEKGIVHRDLKPENIFITSEGRVKILDFGLAKLNPQFAGDGPTFKMATQPGIVMGTVGYMSPEQVRGEAVDHRSDIFSFGTILYEMFTGSRAFQRDTSVETMSAILKDEPVEITELNPNFPAALEKIVRRCLEKQKEQRFQSARDLAFHIECLPPLTISATQAGAIRPSVSMPHPPPTLPPVPQGETRGLPVQSSIHESPTLAQPALRPTASVRAMQRPTVQRRIHKTAGWLIALLAGVIVLAVGFTAGKYLGRAGNGTHLPEFQRITFQRGEVRSARFARDGETIIYSAAWNGSPNELFLTRRNNHETRRLGVADADIVSISKNDELAVLLRRDRASGAGVLARVAMVGGTPREIQDGVVHADWSPDGNNLAVIRQSPVGLRVEYPIGTILYDTPHFIRELHVSPDGKKLAFIEPEMGANDISVIEDRKVRTLARGWSRGANGLAWAPDGESIYVTGSDTAAPPALYQVTLNGDVRVIARLTGSLKLQDIARDGMFLLNHNTWRASLMCAVPVPPPAAEPVTDTVSVAPGTLPAAESIPAPQPVTREEDFAWFDWSMAADLSSDGTTLLFNETREGGGNRSSIYLRKTDGSLPVRLGDGFADALSPDGKWALAHSGGKLVLLPTGSGEVREIKTTGAFDPGAEFFPDGNHVLVAGAEKGGAYALHTLDVTTGNLKRISPEGIWGDAPRPFAISPDGRVVAGMTGDKRIALYPVDGGKPTLLAVTRPEEVPIQWSADGQILYVYNPRELPSRVYRVNLTNDMRELWKEFTPADAAGVYKIAPIFVTPDGSRYAYNSLRILSDLYVMRIGR